MAPKTKRPTFRTAAPGSVVPPMDNENAAAAVAALERAGADVSAHAKTAGNRIRSLEAALAGEQAAHLATHREWEQTLESETDRLVTEHKAEVADLSNKLAMAERARDLNAAKLSAAEAKLRKAAAYIND